MRDPHLDAVAEVARMLVEAASAEGYVDPEDLQRLTSRCRMRIARYARAMRRDKHAEQTRFAPNRLEIDDGQWRHLVRDETPANAESARW